MSDELLTSWVCTALMRIGTRMATGFDQHFAELGITQAQFRILLAVWELGGTDGIAPSVLANHLLIERGTISILTNRMIERGWLVRKPGAFAAYRYHDAMFPTSRFRMAYDLLRRQTPTRAVSEYLAILHLAAQEGEDGVDEALRGLLDQEPPLSAAAVAEFVRR